MSVQSKKCCGGRNASKAMMAALSAMSIFAVPMVIAKSDVDNANVSVSKKETETMDLTAAKSTNEDGVVKKEGSSLGVSTDDIEDAFDEGNRCQNKTGGCGNGGEQCQLGGHCHTSLKCAKVGDDHFHCWMDGAEKPKPELEGFDVDKIVTFTNSATATVADIQKGLL